MRMSRALLATVPVMLLVAACSTSVSVSQADVESQIAEGIATSIGIPAADITVTCPGDLAGEVGKEMTCQADTGTDTGDVLVTVTAVDGTNVSLDWEIVS